VGNEELIKALNINSVAMERHSQTMKQFIQTQELEANKSATNSVYGMYYFNQGASNSVLAQWRQILPRNLRRAQTRLYSLNQSLYIASSDIGVDINSLIQYQANGFSGAIDGAALLTFTTGVGIEIEGTDAIWVASLTGGGSKVEQTAFIGWTEQIYTTRQADPRSVRGSNRAGLEQRLTAGLIQMDGDQRADYDRNGTR
jgi:hypothetical protein